MVYMSLGILGSSIMLVIPLVVIILWLLRLYTKMTAGWCESSRSMEGKTVIITGANTGIGKATALDLARRKARVILACRSMERGQKAAEEIIAETGNDNVVVRLCDLSDMSSIRKFAKHIAVTEERLDVLINNAAMLPPPGRHLTPDGFEVQFATNHLGPFLLTNLLMDLLKKSAPSRIINVASTAYRFATRIDFENLNFEKHDMTRFMSYCRTKLANILFTTELHRQLAGTGITVNALHPGTVETKITRNAHPLYKFFLIPTLYRFQKTVQEGAQTTIYLAISDDIEGVSGKYFADCKEEKLHGQAASEELARKMWDVSAKFVGLTC